MTVDEIVKIKDLLSDDRFDSKDWEYADTIGRIEWLIDVLETKNQEIAMWVDLLMNAIKED